MEILKLSGKMKKITLLPSSGQSIPRNDPATSPARIWIWWNGPTRLRLEPGQTICLHQHHETDEGFYAEGMEITHHGDRIEKIEYSSSRDCDGRFKTKRTRYASILQLQTGAPYRHHAGNQIFIDTIGTERPNWRTEQQLIFDESAQTAGY